jgi:hypothetical protein
MNDAEKDGCVLLQAPLPDATTPERTPLGDWYNSFVSIDNGDE